MQNKGNPVTGAEGIADDIGSVYEPAEGWTQMRVADSVVENAYMTTEAIDPLYTGEYAIAPYERPPVTPSGSPVTLTDWSGVAGTSGFYLATVPRRGVELLAGCGWDAERAGELGCERMVERTALPSGAQLVVERAGECGEQLDAGGDGAG